MCWAGLSEMAASLHPTELHGAEETPEDVAGSDIAGAGGTLLPGVPLLLKSRFWPSGEAASLCARVVVSSAPIGMRQE